MFVEEASAVLPVSHAHLFEVLHYLFQRQDSVTRKSIVQKNWFLRRRRDGAEGSQKAAQKEWLVQDYKGENKSHEYSFFPSVFGEHSFCSSLDNPSSLDNTYNQLCLSVMQDWVHCPVLWFASLVFTQLYTN